MPYPPKPTNKQYGDWFPAIPERPVPAPPGNTTVKESALAMQPDGSKSNETLSLPKKIDFGALNLWASGAGRDSRSFDDGPDFDAEAKDMKFGDDDTVEDFCFAPGTDEKAITLRWHVYGRQHIKSAKLELFARGHDKAIWEHHWGNAWGKKKEEISAFPVNEAMSGKHTSFCQFPFSKVEVDKAAKLKNLAGEEITAFPKGLLTAAFSPYQLRLTVSGCTAEGVPPAGDTFAYPMTAWTYLHVLVDAFHFSIGPKEWLSDQRPDIAKDFREAIVGKRAEGDFGAEGETLAKLTGAVSSTDDFFEGAKHSVSIRSNVGLCSDDFGLHKELWGAGPRIPLVAQPIIRTMSGGSTTDHAADILHGSVALWDWSDDHPLRWQETIDQSLEFQTKKTREYLELLHKRFAEKYEPKNSCNCPVDYGGKWGDPDQPIFPLTGGSADFKFTCKAPRNRPWAAITSFDDKGRTGVIFQPSRMAGDSYDVTVYLYTPALDTNQALKDMDVPSGQLGTFEVVRQRTLYHAKAGKIVGHNMDDMRNLSLARARRQVSLALEFRPLSSTEADHRDSMSKAVDSLWKTDLVCGGSTFPRPICLQAAVDPTKVGNFGIYVRGRKDFQTRLEEMVKGSRIIRVHRTPPVVNGDSRNQKTRYQVWEAPDGSLSEWMTTVTDASDEYFLLAHGDGSFASGNKLKGLASQNDKEDQKPIKEITINLIGGDASCWGFDMPFQSDANKKETIDLKFPDGSVHSIKYTKKKLSRRLRKNMVDSEKALVRTAFSNAAKAFGHKGTPFVVTIIGRNDSTNAQGRIDRLHAFLKSLIEVEFLICDKKVALARLKTEIENWWTKTDGGSWRDQSYKSAFIQLLKGYLTDLRSKHPEMKEGIVFLQCQRPTNLTDLDDRAVHYDNVDAKFNPNADKNDKNFYDLPFGAYFKDYPEPTDPFFHVFYAATPDPNAATTDRQGQSKSITSVFLHELGHALGISHSVYPPGFQGPTAASPNPIHHLKDEGCIMDYHPDTHEFCAICRARHRGWNWLALPNDLAVMKAAVTVKLGDLNSLFGSSVKTDPGMAQRLQALGFFHRPVGYKLDGERAAALNTSKKHAKAILGINDLETELDPHLRNFVIEGGALPTVGKFAKLRLPNNWMPLYSIGDKMHLYPDNKKSDPPNFHDYYSLGADRNRVEKEIWNDNPNLGAIPLHIQVDSVIGDNVQPYAGAHVFIELLPPDTLPSFKRSKDGHKVAGATSFADGHGHHPTFDGRKSGAFIRDKVSKYQPGASSDPQKDNVHFEFGGKRGLSAAQHISLSGANGRNIFAAMEPGFPDLPPNGYEVKGDDTDKTRPEPRPNTVCVVADDHGCVDVLFRPSLIGGDKYKLRVYVEDPTGEKTVLGEFTTGTMVRWRCLRVSGFFQVPNATSKDEIPEYFRTLAVGDGKPLKEASDILDWLATPDLSGDITEQFAQSYNELLIEDAALAPQPLSGNIWNKVLAEYSRKAGVYPDLTNNTRSAGAGVARFALQKDSPTTFSITVNGSIMPGTVTLRKKGSTELAESIAHDWSDAIDPNSITERNLVALEPGTPVTGNPQRKKTGEKINLEGTVNPATGVVRVIFKTPPAEDANFDICCHLKDFIDVENLLGGTHAKSRLFLFPYVNPDDYDQSVGPRTATMAATGNLQRAVINKEGFGTTDVLLGSLARSIMDNGPCNLPGLIIVQAALRDPYSTIWSVLSEGKGWGNVIFLFTPSRDKDQNDFEKRLNRLLVHEMSHGLYLEHAPGNGSQKGTVADLHDPTEKDCLMTYSDKLDKEHCGPCNALLRGMSVFNSPLTGKKKHPHENHPVPSPGTIGDDSDEQGGLDE